MSLRFHSLVKRKAVRLAAAAFLLFALLLSCGKIFARFYLLGRITVISEPLKNCLCLAKVARIESDLLFMKSFKIYLILFG